MNDYYQFAYVTNDFERAMEEISRTQAIGGFMELRDLALPTGGGTHAHAHFALAFKGELQFEIIQPLAEEVVLYLPYLPSEGYALRFHHLGKHLDSRRDYDLALQGAKQRWPITVEEEMMGTAFAYVDSRKDLGHYLEYFSFPPDSPFTKVPRF
jgi:Glyoxalase/Bleomycin resistance protein/Dioxygenase superfamily